MASSIVTQTILFIAVLAMATGLIFGIKAFVDNTQNSIKTQSDEFNNQIGTSFNIELVYFNNNTNETSVFIRNTGQTSIKIEQVDIYINGIRFPRNESNRTIEVLADTEVTDIGVWDPKEAIKIVAKMGLEENKKHTVVVTTPYSGRDSEYFSI